MILLGSKGRMALVLGSVLAVACGGNSTTGSGAGGSAGTGGSSAAGGQSGSGGQSGGAGAGGHGGSSGAGGHVATGGSGGNGGYAGAAGGSAGYGGLGGYGGGLGGYGGGLGGSGGTTTGASCTANPSACIVPPPPGPEANNTSGTLTVIAISRLFLGDTNRQGQTDPNAWKSIGYNIDGLISKPSDTNHCKPQPGANPAAVKTDGNGGIDNSFGENLIPLITSLAADPSATTNQSISSGAFTDIFKLDNLLDPAQKPYQNGITAALYVGANKGSPALFDGTDVWPVTYESVNNGDINSPKVKFPASYVAGGLWVSGTKATLDLPVGTQGLQLPISDATFTMHITGTGSKAKATDGTIAGVINTQDLIAAFKKVAGTIDPTLCSGPTFDSIAQQVAAASDIMSDGTNGDPAKTCDAISVGIGFNGAAVKLGKVAAPATPPPDPCAP